MRDDLSNYDDNPAVRHGSFRAVVRLPPLQPLGLLAATVFGGCWLLVRTVLSLPYCRTASWLCLAAAGSSTAHASTSSAAPLPCPAVAAAAGQLCGVAAQAAQLIC